MKFKIDENCTFEVARLLNEHGFDSHTVHDEKIVGSTDDKIYDICIKEKRTLITLDLDFADMRRYPPKSGTGIIHDYGSWKRTVYEFEIDRLCFSWFL